MCETYIWVYSNHFHKICVYSGWLDVFTKYWPVQLICRHVKNLKKGENSSVNGAQNAIKKLNAKSLSAKFDYVDTYGIRHLTKLCAFVWVHSLRLNSKSVPCSFYTGNKMVNSSCGSSFFASTASSAHVKRHVHWLLVLVAVLVFVWLFLNL